MDSANATPLPATAMAHIASADNALLDVSLGLEALETIAAGLRHEGAPDDDWDAVANRLIWATRSITRHVDDCRAALDAAAKAGATAKKEG
ncbi:hypothetical protein [Rhodocista pekingensis]|uniref:Uncharacterized protein n=1 Tax=Rhodocista pekingensis TaxID=201185 RepID=A0ABW2KWU4_9PROT